MRAMAMLGDPYSEEDLAGAEASLEGVTEAQALIAYLQGLGTNRTFRE